MVFRDRSFSQSEVEVGGKPHPPTSCLLPPPRKKKQKNGGPKPTWNRVKGKK